MRILITGGAGFIGSHVVDAFLEAGHQVGVVDDLSAGHRERVPAGVTFHQSDILDPDLASIFAASRPEVVVHHAAQVSVPRSVADPRQDMQTNVLGTLAVLEAALVAGVGRLVYASSAAVYGNPVYLPLDETHPTRPISPYGLSKLVGEQYITLYGQQHGLSAVCLRYANVYGPRQDALGEAGVVTRFCQALAEGRPPVVFGTGEQSRDFVYVGDVARANVLAAEHGESGVLNIGSGRPTSIRSLWSVMARLDGASVEIDRAAPPPGDIAHSWFDIRRASEILGWQPKMDLLSGLRLTFDYFKEPS